MRHYFQDKSLTLGKRERTRSQLVDGTIAAIAEHGVQGTSIKEITSTAGVSNGTFYNHFDDRDEIIRYAAYSVAKEITDEIAVLVANEKDGIARIVLSTNMFISRALEAPEWGAMIVDAARFLGDVRHDIADHFHEDVALAMEQGKITETPSPFLVHQVSALILLAIEIQLKSGIDRSICSQTCEAALRLLGVSPAKARKAVESHLNHGGADAPTGNDREVDR